MLSKEKILQKIQENFIQIRQFGVQRIGIFGSYVKGSQTATSDVDILVDFDPKQKTFDNYMELKFFLEDLFDTKVDLVLQEALKPVLKPHILGEVVYAT